MIKSCLSPLLRYSLDTHEKSMGQLVGEVSLQYSLRRTFDIVWYPHNLASTLPSIQHTKRSLRIPVSCLTHTPHVGQVPRARFEPVHGCVCSDHHRNMLIAYEEVFSRKCAETLLDIAPCEEESAKVALRYGAWGHIEKPLDFAAFVHQIRTAGRTSQWMLQADQEKRCTMCKCESVTHVVAWRGEAEGLVEKTRSLKISPDVHTLRRAGEEIRHQSIT